MEQVCLHVALDEVPGIRDLRGEELHIGTLKYPELKAWPEVCFGGQGFTRTSNIKFGHVVTVRRVTVHHHPLCFIHGSGHTWECLHIDYTGPFWGKMFLVVLDVHSIWLEEQIVSSAVSPTPLPRCMFA